MTDVHRQMLGQAARNARETADTLETWSRRKAKPDCSDAEALGVILNSIKAAIDEIAKPFPLTTPKRAMTPTGLKRRESRARYLAMTKGGAA